MTLSDDDRRNAISEAQRRALEDLGNSRIDGVHFHIRSERYRDLPETTWEEMQHLGWVEPRHRAGDPAFRLTGSGWIAALKAMGRFEAQRDNAVTLRAALKDVVKGRPVGGASTDFYVMTQVTGLADDWIFNALESRLLQHLWPKEHLDVELKHGKKMIRVPSRFGANRLFGVAGPFPDP